MVTSATSCFSQASQQYSRIANLHREKQNKKEEEEEEEEEKTEEPRCTQGYSILPCSYHQQTFTLP
jgi:ribosomal protein L12E/L44/L45/RPP1/RPP2